MLRASEGIKVQNKVSVFDRASDSDQKAVLKVTKIPLLIK